MWRVRTHCGTASERAATRTWAVADRKVLDLEQRLVYRLFYARGQAVVSIKWERIKRRSKLSSRWRMASLTKTIAVSELRGSERHLKCIPSFSHLQKISRYLASYNSEFTRFFYKLGEW
jgi:hypothetical protein